MLIPGGRSIPWGQGVGTVWAAKESLMVPRGRASSFQVRSHPSASCAASWSAYLAAQGMIMHIIRRWTDPVGARILGSRRPGPGRVCYQVWRLDVWSIQSGRAVGLGLQRAPSQLRSGPEPGRWNRWPVRPCRPRLGADGEPSDLASSPLRLREPYPCAHLSVPALLVSDRDRFFQASAWHDSD